MTQPLISPIAALGEDCQLDNLIGVDGVARFRLSTDIVTQRPEETILASVGAVQRLLTLAAKANEVFVRWDEGASKIALASPSIFPLIAVLVCLKNGRHEVDGGAHAEFSSRVLSARRSALEYQLKTDPFADCQISLCADSLGYSKCRDFYEQSNGELLRGEDMEALVEDIIMPYIQTSGGGALYHSRLAVSSIVSELFENTHLHGRRTVQNHPVAPNCIRGFIIRRIRIGEKRGSLAAAESAAFGLELSIFDSGVGYYASFTGKQLEENVPIDDEWRVVHECLKRHYDDPLPENRLTHHGLGLYKVLRAIKIMKGQFELRTGRIHGYRSFIEGELPLQMEPETSTERPGMPKPVLLDKTRRYLSRPAEHEMLVGASVSIVLPLKA